MVILKCHINFCQILKYPLKSVKITLLWYWIFVVYSNARCQRRISAPSGYFIKLTALHFDLESLDYLEVFDGRILKLSHDCLVNWLSTVLYFLLLFMISDYISPVVLYYFTSCTIFHDSGDAYHPLHIFSHSLAHVILNDMFLDHHKTHICRSVFAISVSCNCNNVGNKGTSLLTSSFQSLLACCPHHIVDKQRIQNSAKRCFLRTVGSCHTSFLCSPLAACSSSNWLQVGCDMSWLFLWLSSVPLNVYYPSR